MAGFAGRTSRSLHVNRAIQMDLICKTDFAIAHTTCLARSLKRWTGRELLSGVSNPIEVSQKIFEAPFVLVSHDTEADPVLNYGNAAALALWEMSWGEFTRTPSRLTAEAPNRKEQARLLEVVTQQGFIDDYSGVRISKTGKRFQIFRATVWNLISESGEPCGQAAMFYKWKFL
jgi:hypothetical protein